MPCYDPRSDWDDEIKAKELAHVTKLLCEACEMIYDRGEAKMMSEEMVSWFSLHRLIDIQNKELERLENPVNYPRINKAQLALIIKEVRAAQDEERPFNRASWEDYIFGKKDETRS